MNCIICNSILKLTDYSRECYNEITVINGYTYSHFYVYNHKTQPIFHVMKEKYSLTFDSRIKKLSVDLILEDSEIEILKINQEESDFINFCKLDNLILEDKIKLYQTFS